MSTERPDEFDEIPFLEALPPGPGEPDRDLRDDLHGPPRRPGFGFWKAVLWCLAFLLVTQVLTLIVCGLPIAFVFMMKEIARNGMATFQDPDKTKEWTQGDDGRLMMVSILIASHLVGLLFGWLMLRWYFGGRTWKRRIALTRRPSLTHWALLLIGMPAALALSGGLEQPIMRYVPSIQDLLNRAHIDFEWPGIEAIEPLLRKTPFALALFTIAVLPAFNEEFWCRGFLGQNLAGRYRTVAVMLMTGFLFGAIHLEPRQGLWAMFFGAAIYGAYVATRSLWAAMFIHFVNNGLAVVHSSDQINWPVLKPFEDLLERSPTFFVTSAALLFGAVCYALYQTRCRLVSENSEAPEWQPPGASGVALPPPDSGTIVTHDPLSPTSVALILTGAVAFGLVMALA
jgi:membrane protease YdiL (CAAX protease family)